MEAMFKEFYKNAGEIQSFWEQRISETMEEAVKSQHFISAMTKSLESSLDVRQLFDASISRWAEMYQIVTKKDLAVLQQQMFDQNMQMEKSIQILEDIRDALIRQTGGRTPAPVAPTQDAGPEREETPAATGERATRAKRPTTRTRRA